MAHRKLHTLALEPAWQACDQGLLNCTTEDENSAAHLPAQILCCRQPNHCAHVPAEVFDEVLLICTHAWSCINRVGRQKDCCARV